ncbi:exocyst complex component 3-like [Ptychodera flava]|uniref:exocyst complex component 3-like n=1 Tax=Ptychodera flava TaxID=63121 RepID=UPI00396A4B68
MHRKRKQPFYRKTSSRRESAAAVQCSWYLRTLCDSNRMSAHDDFYKAEADAKAAAAKHVANMLQKPGQLEKVDQYRRRIARKKASVEARLKTAVQSQLDGVRTGLGQLQSALEDIKEIRQSLKEVDEMYRSCEKVHSKLAEVKTQGAEHSQLAAAVENLKHIFTVPESVAKTEDLIEDGKLLLAHKSLMDLETSRDDLLFELHKTPTEKSSGDHLIKTYFADVQKLSDMLAKQLWLVMERSLTTVRKDPTLLVTALRIIEREERIDKKMLERERLTGFLPPGRPKNWRDECYKVLEKSAQNRIEGNQIEDREDEKMWLVRHLEITRRIILEDLKVVKHVCQPCFPPAYDIFNRFAYIYHKYLSRHLEDMISDQLKDTEIVSLLSWLKEYEGPELMQNPDLQVNLVKLGPLLREEVVDSLLKQYLQTMHNNIQKWMRNTLDTDIQDWHKDIEPEADEKGFYLTQLPVILFQMIEQNLQVAAQIGKDLTRKVLNLCVDEIKSFVNMYKDAIYQYKNKHLEDRSQPRYYIHYMVAIINNCKKFIDFTKQLEIRYKKPATDDKEGSGNITNVGDEFNKLAVNSCKVLLDEVFMDLESHFQQILTRTWLQLPTSNAVETVCVTIEDYYHDFLHLKTDYFNSLMKNAENKVILAYLKALTEKRINFKSYEERKSAAEKIESEAEQIQGLFERLAPDNKQDSPPCQPITMLSEFIKLKDTSMMSLEISTLAAKYPDVHHEHIIAVLMIRGDLNKSEAKQLVTETLGDFSEESRANVPKGIFSGVPIPK